MTEEPDSSDSQEDQPQPREAAEAVRKQLLEMFEQWNSDNHKKKPVPQCLLQEGQRLLLDTRMPAYLPPHDDRFNVKKNCGSLSATHLIADRWSVFHPHKKARSLGVLIASSRAPSLATTGAISLPS